MPKLLDLFCGAGGAAMGYHRAGFDDIVGVDIEPQPDYPFTFIQANALEFMAAFADQSSEVLDVAGSTDLIHASPPCQAFSTMTGDREHPDLIAPVRNLLYGRHHVIENVRAAPLRRDLMLCGSMFRLQVQRHRWFETTWSTMAYPCVHDWPEGRPWTITGDLKADIDDRYPHSWKPSFARAKELMGMDWVTDVRGITEAIPPAYTEYIGTSFLDTMGLAG